MYLGPGQVVTVDFVEVVFAKRRSWTITRVKYALAIFGTYLLCGLYTEVVLEGGH